jgi:hypothetical protein
MASILINSQLWPLRVIAVSALAFLLALGSFTPVFAEEAVSEPPAEEAVSEPPAEEAVSEPPAEEAVSEPAPEAEDVWAVVDPNTGDVLNIIVCTQSMCGTDGVTGGKLQDGETGIVGDLVRQGTQATGGWRTDTQYGGGTSVTYDRDTKSFNVNQRSGADSSTSFRITPQEGQDWKVSDIGSSITKRSGDTSATLRTFRFDLQDPNLSATLELPDVGGGTFRSYLIGLGPNESSERPRILDQIAADVDTLLLEDGYVTEETTLDNETGEEATTKVLNSSNDFVVAIREVTSALVDWLSSQLGFARGQS